MTSESIWRTWKPYAVVAAIGIAGIWWYNSQSSIARLKDGAYVCQGVFVNASNKYEVLTAEDGSSYSGSATVSGGELTSLTGDSALSAADIAALTVRSKGDSHFHATDDPAMHSYYAVACDYDG